MSSEKTPTAHSDTRVLFDGSSLEAWRGFGMDDVPEGWSVTPDGEIHAAGAHGPDLITRERFRDFDLMLEWKLARGGNSGILFRVGEALDAPWKSGPEMQLLDDARHPDGDTPETRAGANYLLHPPTGDVAPAPEVYHRARIRVVGDEVAYWLDGQQVVRYRLGSEDWQRRVEATKFAPYPEYGRLPEGHIALQDHGDPVWFRNVRLQVVPSA